ncbi:sensor histidine kinase [Parasedimentitalea psychrophila]|uniref:C4-dicarboxylate transport sensor protein DctB n=1 Tax=Parasedimentitalea psychrophila TaxID=2997337 RepID=A0A9Y2KXW9_9RHOB|nr:ATP-binding protein [Parasedimentitalea psychrophila]WIY24051.1 ATP-binding protein [Parasedimentitalea psychrophila]
MRNLEGHRGWIVLGFALALAALTGAVWSYGYRQALDVLARQGEADLELASDRVSTQLQVYQELAVLMARHPALEQLSGEESRRAAVRLLRDVADSTAALDVFYADASGRVLVAAQGITGPDVSGTDYFSRAMHGALGTGHGVLQPLNRRAFFYAAPDFGADGTVRGALVTVADVVDVEQTWRGSLPAVFFTDRNGEVFISNRSELLLWQRQPGETGLQPQDGRQVVFSAHRVSGHEIWQLGWGPYLPQRALHRAVDLPVIGMIGEILLDTAPARRIATLQAAALAGICLAFGALLFLATERRRTLALANVVLESRVTKRTRALSASNMQLRREVKERQGAEAALTLAQQELVQAGKLSALGQMSAGISHELNQPLMAIQQYADNGSAFLQQGKADRAGENLGRISDMATRMARIIKNLRAFARNESEPVSRVDLVKVITAAVELTQARLQADQVSVDWNADQYDAPVYAWGGEVRLAQVFVNLINNAADAMLDQDDRQVHISINTGDRLAVTVSDVGPGIKEPEKVFEPFYSTKTVGSSDGMGLGLSISYGLVQSFGGNIRGVNVERGAMFTVELDYWTEEDVV